MKNGNVSSYETEEIQKLRKRIEALERAQAICKQTEDALRSMVYIDELTGLYNRRGFLSMVEKQFTLFKRNKANAIVLFADVDYLKQINDTFGHQAGDNALIDTAMILKDTFRESDVIGRLGGDEYAVLAMVNDAFSSKKLLLRLKTRTRKFNEANNRDYKISLSTGIVNCDPEYKYSIEELLVFADKFMYTHKRASKSKSSVID